MIIRSTERLYIISDDDNGGYFYVRPKTGGGIALEERTSFNNPAKYNDTVLKQGNYLYWLEDSGKIKQMEISDNNQTVELYSDEAIYIGDAKTSLTVSGDYLIFYKYITATNIGTYRLKIGEDTSEIISEHDAKVQDIVELTF